MNAEWKTENEKVNRSLKEENERLAREQSIQSKKVEELERIVKVEVEKKKKDEEEKKKLAGISDFQLYSFIMKIL